MMLDQDPSYVHGQFAYFLLTFPLYHNAQQGFRSRRAQQYAAFIAKPLRCRLYTTAKEDVSHQRIPVAVNANVYQHLRV